MGVRLHGHHVHRRDRRRDECLVDHRRDDLRGGRQRPVGAVRRPRAARTDRRSRRTARHRPRHRPLSGRGVAHLGNVHRGRLAHDARSGTRRRRRRDDPLYLGLHGAPEGRAVHPPIHYPGAARLGSRRRRRPAPVAGTRPAGLGTAASPGDHPVGAPVSRQRPRGPAPAVVPFRAQGGRHVQVGSGRSAPHHRGRAHHELQWRPHHGVGTRAIAELRQASTCRA